MGLLTCIICNSELAEDVHFCGNCGQKVGAPKRTRPQALQNDEPEGYRYAISIRWIIALTILSCGIYWFYWFYITWKQYRDHTGERVFPFWHAMTQLIPFLWLYPLFRVHAHIRQFVDLADRGGIETNLSAPWTTRMILFAELLLWVSFYFTDWGFGSEFDTFESTIVGLISLGTISLITYTLVRVQTGINIYWGEVLPGAYLYKKLGVFDVLVIIFGGLFWLLIISGLFM